MLETNTSHQSPHSHEINKKLTPLTELAALGIHMSEAEIVGKSAERRTSHLCVRMSENPLAKDGEIFRVEVYRDMHSPQQFFFVVYRWTHDTEGKRIMTNQFFTNDQQYAQRHRWMDDSKQSFAIHQPSARDITHDMHDAMDAIISRFEKL